MDKDWILVRYGEIGLKSDQVREKFEHRLMNNMRAGFEKENVDAEVRRGYGRIFVNTEETEEASRVLQRVFGIVSFSPCIKLEADLEQIAEMAGKVGEEVLEKNDSFAVRARRTGKHDFTSKDIEREAGAEVVELTDAEVDLDNPDKIVWVEVRQNRCYLFTQRVDGPGGMPLGTQGEVLSLFKGDCNSWLATWLLMKRGCSVVLLHGDISPYRNEDKVEKSVKELRRWSYGAPLKLLKFDFGQDLFELQEDAPRELTCILCRRFLIKLASRIAREKSYRAIVSGESSGRSFRDFKLEDSATNLPVLRPLVGFANDEIRSKCSETGGDFLLEKEKCKARSETTSKISEKELKSVEDKLNFEELLKEKFEDMVENENS